MREKDMDSPLKLDESVEIEDVQIHLGFIDYNDEQLDQFLHEHNMAMTLDDIKLIQAYFCRKEHRNPTETELKVLDTYWSDHCRHTTFETVLQNVTFESGRFHEILESTYNEYCEMRQRVHHNRKPMTLMDMATISMKEQRRLGLLKDLEVSDEINACSIFIDVDVDGVIEPWLLMFKNENITLLKLNHLVELQLVLVGLSVTHYLDAHTFIKRCVSVVEQIFLKQSKKRWKVNFHSKSSLNDRLMEIVLTEIKLV